eukprot:CAMPEP_0177703890 /NCGR_PEP_ID=MMETSP0484_2-20121128/7910_1 /TAXON_ID=354590 /ORGANISM="Rhodomonas lens, Strain RHODO" /LENGTH=270 /DNA_ID=CAMNT_0019215269 /DNA_START=114 /DNA_END=926 /DNA_ORIENTATION=+
MTYRTPKTTTPTSKMENVAEHKCMLGVAVVWGTPARRACASPAELDAALLRSAQTDNAKFISHLICDQGWRPTRASSCCNFGITIDRSAAARRWAKPLTETHAEEAAANTSTQQVWQVSCATPLHLALSCGSFKAAAVLLVAFPEFATQTCTITTPTNQQITWSCFELAQFSSSQLLAAAQEEGEERERERKRGREAGSTLPLAPPSSFLIRAMLFQQASLVLLQLHHGIPSSWTFLHFASPYERLEAAGEDPDLLLQALVALQAPSSLS